MPVSSFTAVPVALRTWSRVSERWRAASSPCVTADNSEAMARARSSRMWM